MRARFTARCAGWAGQLGPHKKSAPIIPIMNHIFRQLSNLQLSRATVKCHIVKRTYRSFEVGMGISKSASPGFDRRPNQAFHVQACLKHLMLKRARYRSTRGPQGDAMRGQTWRWYSPALII